MRRRVIVIGCVLALAASCTSEHDAADIGRRGTAATSVTSASSGSPVTSEATPSSVGSSGPATSTPTTPTTTPATTVLRGTAVAGAAGGVEPAGPPYAQTDPFAEAVRLADGTCTGWPESRGGSTAGLAVGAPVAVLDPTTNALLGTGSVTASRWEDPSGGGGQWTCSFDFTAEAPGAPAEVLVKVGVLEPWTARPDPRDPTARVASVSTDASIAAIASCPALPATTTPSTVPGATALPATTAAPAGAPVTGWSAVGTYWSIGVDALCRAGLPVVSLARPCRRPNQGSEYITDVVDANRSTVHFANGDPIPAGTQLTAVVATGRPCE